MRSLIVGCGYLGQRVASQLQHQGLAATGVVRSEVHREELKKAGIPAVAADLDHPVNIPPLLLAGVDLFYFIPPPRDGEQDLRVASLIQSFERWGHPRRVVYLSTTGVYGDCGGAWVDERRPVAPVVPRALRRWDAEQRFRRWRERGGGELVILRVAGIYGPGKLPLERLRKGVPMVRASEAPYSNRIHIDDLLQVCVAAMDRGRDGAVYNVSDGRPSTMIDYFDRIADLAGLPRPPQISLTEAEGRLSPGMLSYMHESRRLDNRLMREELGVALRFPDLERGLPGCISAVAKTTERRSATPSADPS